jgi:alanine dehydrogenase
MKNTLYMVIGGDFVMLIGVPKEIKNQEYRVGLTPESAGEVVKHGHQIIVETNAGIGIGCSDQDYEKAGAEIVRTAQEVFDRAEMIVKVKEPQPNECKMLRKGQVLFTYLHLAPDLKQAEDLVTSGCTAIAYETVTDNRGQLPLLAPMSEVAGRLSIQAGAHCLEKKQGGLGVLLGGVPGVAPAKVVVIGGGFVGTNAIMVAVGMGAQVTILDKSIKRLQELNLKFGNALNTVYSTAGALEKYVLDADLVVGAVLIPGAAAPKLISKDMLKHMRQGSVLVDVAIDQGGCFATSHATTHDNPTYIIDGIVHYCVANMPGAVPRTSTFALNNATLPYTLTLADKGCKKALLSDKNLLNGLNVHAGYITYKAVADDLGMKYMDPLKALEV